MAFYAEMLSIHPSALRSFLFLFIRVYIYIYTLYRFLRVSFELWTFLAIAPLGSRVSTTTKSINDHVVHSALCVAAAGQVGHKTRAILPCSSSVICRTERGASVQLTASLLASI